MKICVFTDVHGNVDALKMLMKTNDFQQADMRIFLGDVAVMGPFGEECCKLVVESGCIWLLGNHDSYISHGLPARLNFSESKKAHQKYIRDRISENYKELMKKLPKKYTISHNGKTLLFVHYLWEDEEMVVDNPDNPNLEKVEKIFGKLDADYIFFGHEHAFSHFKGNGKEYICVGSLGMKHPGSYSVITLDDEIKIEHKEIDFDLDKFKNDILSAGYPRAEKYIKFFD